MTPTAILNASEVPAVQAESVSPAEQDSLQAIRQEADRLEMELDHYEATANRLSGARGVLFGILLGTGMWAVVTVFVVTRFTK